MEPEIVLDVSPETDDGLPVMGVIIILAGLSGFWFLVGYMVSYGFHG